MPIEAYNQGIIRKKQYTLMFVARFVVFNSITDTVTIKYPCISFIRGKYMQRYSSIILRFFSKTHIISSVNNEKGNRTV